MDNPLRKFRKANKLTALDIANRMEVSERSILAWETGAFSPGHLRMARLASFLTTEPGRLELEWKLWKNSLRDKK